MANLTPEQAAQLADAQRRLRDSGMGGDVADSLADQLTLGTKVAGGVQGYERFGNGTWDDAVNGYRANGAQLQGRAAPTLDTTQTAESRGLQMGSLGMLRAQADGSAPSSSAILSQRANQDATMQAGSAVAGVKGGPGAHIAALRGAGATAAGQAMASNVNVANQRAGEISRGQGQYAGGANDLRGQDINAATLDAQLVAQQRALNEKGQQHAEGLAYNTRGVQQRTGMTAQQQQNDDVAALKQIRAGEKARQLGDIATGGSLFLGAVTGGMGAAGALSKSKAAKPAPAPAPVPGHARDVSDSDMDTKMRVGSLGRLMRGGR